MPSVTIPEKLEPIVNYIVQGSEHQFTFKFFVVRTEDLFVYVNDKLVDKNNYTVTGIDNPQGGYVDINKNLQPLVKGDQVTLFRFTLPEQLTEFIRLGDFTAVAVNAEFNRLYALMQELRRDALTKYDDDTQEIEGHVHFEDITFEYTGKPDSPVQLKEYQAKINALQAEDSRIESESKSRDYSQQLQITKNTDDIEWLGGKLGANLPILPWVKGGKAVNPFQRYMFLTDPSSPAYGFTYNAPSATKKDPVLMGDTPASDRNWHQWDVSQNDIKDFLTPQKPFLANKTTVARSLDSRFGDIIDALSNGISTNNTPAQNQAAFETLCARVNREGGLISFPPGEYNLGSPNHTWGNSSAPWYKQPQRGIVGAGIGVTNLIFENSSGSIFTGAAYWIYFDGFSCESALWAYTQDYPNLGTDVSLFDMGDQYSPRLKLGVVKASGFMKAFRFWFSVAEFGQVEAFQCKYPFIFPEGTSMQVSGSLYAHDCLYGHILGCDLYRHEPDLTKDSVFSRSGGLTYTSLRALACDRSLKASYVIGEIYGDLTSCGCEIPIDTPANKHLGQILFPPLVFKDSGNPSSVTLDGGITINDFHNLSNVTEFSSGQGAIHIARNNCVINLNSLVSKGGTSNSPTTLRNLITFDDSVHTCYMDINGKMRSQLARMPSAKNVKGISIGGVYKGDVVLVQEGLLTQTDIDIDTFDVTAEINGWSGDKKLHVALKGSQYQTSGAKVVLDIADMFTAANLECFYGTIIARARWNKSNPSDPNATFVQVQVNGSNSDISATLEPSTKNTDGVDIVFAFSGSSGLANRSYSVRANVETGAKFVDGDNDKWIVWCE